MIIDSHQHFWQLDLPFEYDWLRTEVHQPICKNYLPADLQPHLQSRGISHSVFVQTQHNVEENRWVLRLAEENDFIKGVVGWLDLRSEQLDEQLEQFASHIPRYLRFHK